jgi:hypothetical protein
MASTLREDLAEARAGLVAKLYDERLAKHVAALEWLLKDVLKKVERLRRIRLAALDGHGGDAGG